MLQFSAVGVPLIDVMVRTTGACAAIAQLDVPPHWPDPFAKVEVLAPPVIAVRSEPSKCAPLSVPMVPSARLSRLITTFVDPWTAQNTRVKTIAVGGLITRINPESDVAGARSVIAAVRVCKCDRVVACTICQELPLESKHTWALPPDVAK